MTGSTSLYDEKGNLRSDFALADVLGVSYAGNNRYPYFYIEQSPPGLLK